MTNDEDGNNAFLDFCSGIPKVNKNHGLFTRTIILSFVCIMYIINILQLYFLFVAQWSVRSGLYVSLNNPCSASPTLPRIIDSTLHFVSLTTYVGNARNLSCLLTEIFHWNLRTFTCFTLHKRMRDTARISWMTGTFERKLIINNNTARCILLFLRRITKGPTMCLH